MQAGNPGGATEAFLLSSESGEANLQLWVTRRARAFFSQSSMEDSWRCRNDKSYMERELVLGVHLESICSSMPLC